MQLRHSGCGTHLHEEEDEVMNYEEDPRVSMTMWRHQELWPEGATGGAPTVREE